MVCDTVMLGCAFGLVIEGSPPENASVQLVWWYIGFLGASIMLLTIGLWCSFIVSRRLYMFNANSMHDKFASDSESDNFHREVRMMCLVCA